MTSGFLRSFAKEARLSAAEMAVLSTADVRSYADVDSLLRSFPSIEQEGVEARRLSNIAALQISASYSAVVEQTQALLQVAGAGAEPPAGVPWPLGSRVPIGSPPTSHGGGPLMGRVELFRLPIRISMACP